jgi:hypothetical protein
VLRLEAEVLCVVLRSGAELELCWWLVAGAESERPCLLGAVLRSGDEC